MEKRVTEMTRSELRGTIQEAIIVASLALVIALGTMASCVRLVLSR
jgi:hypothetical protein